MIDLFTRPRYRGHRRTDPACSYHHGRTPARSRGKACQRCHPVTTYRYPVTGEYGPRTYVAVVAYAAAPKLPALPVGMEWTVQYVPDSTFAVRLYRNGRRTYLTALAPLCELRTETVIAMARHLNKRRAYVMGDK